jgi:hypothetical protein
VSHSDLTSALVLERAIQDLVLHRTRGDPASASRNDQAVLAGPTSLRTVHQLRSCSSISMFVPSDHEGDSGSLPPSVSSVTDCPARPVRVLRASSADGAAATTWRCSIILAPPPHTAGGQEVGSRLVGDSKALSVRRSASQGTY